MFGIIFHIEDPHYELHYCLFIYLYNEVHIAVLVDKFGETVYFILKNKQIYADTGIESRTCSVV